MDIGIEIKEKFSLVHVDGEIGEDDLDKLKESIDLLVNKGYMHVVLDLTGVSYMTANGLGALVNHWSRIRFRRGDLRIVGLNSRLMHFFRMMGVDQMLDIYPDIQTMMEKTGRMPAIA